MPRIVHGIRTLLVMIKWEFQWSLHCDSLPNDVLFCRPRMLTRRDVTTLTMHIFKLF